jgi:hypothetical protein
MTHIPKTRKYLFLIFDLAQRAGVKTQLVCIPAPWGKSADGLALGYGRFAQRAVIRRRLAEQVNLTLCGRPSKADTRAAGKIFSNVDGNIEVGENVSFS